MNGRWFKNHFSPLPLSKGISQRKARVLDNGRYFWEHFESHSWADSVSIEIEGENWILSRFQRTWEQMRLACESPWPTRETYKVLENSVLSGWTERDYYMKEGCLLSTLYWQKTNWWNYSAASKWHLLWKSKMTQVTEAQAQRGEPWAQREEPQTSEDHSQVLKPDEIFLARFKICLTLFFSFFSFSSILEQEYL